MESSIQLRHQRTGLLEHQGDGSRGPRVEVLLTMAWTNVLICPNLGGEGFKQMRERRK